MQGKSLYFCNSLSTVNLPGVVGCLGGGVEGAVDRNCKLSLNVNNISLLSGEMFPLMAVQVFVRMRVRLRIYTMSVFDNSFKIARRAFRRVQFKDRKSVV